MEERKIKINEEKSKRMKEYQESITPEQRHEMVEKSKVTRANNNVVKKTINEMFNKDYLVFDNSDAKFKKATGVEAGFMELMRIILDKDVDPNVKIKALQFMADYSGNKPTEKKETTNVNFSFEGFIEKMQCNQSDDDAVEVVNEEDEDSE